ncbi:MAG: hypothetical protein LBB84_04010 [Tannerellaceae bacterium]|jgi:hypothetical protein|nr:hypothetical protein [Tannerellaceae bacterium]
MLHTMLHAGYQPATDYVNQWGESSREKDSLLDGYYTPEQAGDIVALAENYIR